MNSKYLDMAPPVSAALKSGTPLVVVETGFFMQLPYPRNLTALQDCEESLWRRDCVPCCVAVIDGRIRAGLTKEDMEVLCQHPAALSREELPSAVGSGKTGGATASAALCIAKMIGAVPVMAPGLSDTPADLNALVATGRMAFCGRVLRDARTLYLSHGVVLSEPEEDAEALGDTYAVMQELEFPESVVALCGPTLGDLAERASSAAKALKRRNNFT